MATAIDLAIFKHLHAFKIFTHWLSHIYSDAVQANSWMSVLLDNSVGILSLFLYACVSVSPSFSSSSVLIYLDTSHLVRTIHTTGIHKKREREREPETH